jgi:hypothetical protein
MKHFVLASSLLLCLAASPADAGSGGEGQLVVPTLATTGVDTKVAPVLTELVLEALLTRHRLPALGPSDLKDMLNVEQQRQLLGCEESQCLSELAGALGAARLVSGLVGRLGELYLINLKMVDLASAQVLARASKKFARIEDAPEIIGPLVDELVGAKPQLEVDGRQLITLRKNAEASVRAASVEDFCRLRAPSYFTVIVREPSTKDRLEARRLVLMDLLLTPFLAELESKLACLNTLGQSAEATYLAGRRASNSEIGAARHVGAGLEWQALKHGARLVEEVYRLGLEKEKLGTGARPVELPFVLKPVRLRPRSAAAQAFVATFEEAQKVVNTACHAVSKEMRSKFVLSFARPTQNSRIDPRDLYVARLQDWEEAYLDACPVSALDDTELEDRARTYRDSGVVRGCARKISRRDKTVTFADVELIREGETFKIRAWSKAER